MLIRKTYWLSKVDQMQVKLDALIKATEKDQRTFKQREVELIKQLTQKQSELTKLQSRSQNTESFRQESQRKDHVIEGMQQTFVMILTRSIDKIRSILEQPPAPP